MIQKMKKLTFLITSKEYEKFISDIRNLGVIHIDQLQEGATSTELQENMAVAERYKAAFKALDYAVESYEASANDTTSDNGIGNALQLLEHIESLVQKENTLKHQLDAANKNIEALEHWGEFNWDTIHRLEAEGYKANFYTVSSKLFRQDWVEELYATPISEFGGKTFFVTFSKEQPDITAELISLPDKSLSDYEAEKTSLEAEITTIHNEFLYINEHQRDLLTKGQIDNDNDLSLSKVHLSHTSVADDAVRLLQGWTLEETESAVIEYLEQNNIYYDIEKPSIDDNVPIQLKNNAYTKLFEPILKMYSLPRYNDLDVTPFLAPFFMLFFGLCMGDAGYGLLILIASIIAKSKLKYDMKPYANLGMILGGMTIICGTLTGSFFGIDLTQQDWAFLSGVKPYFISENNYKIFGYSPMMVIAVVIGLIQVLFGMVLAGVKAARLYGWKFGIGKFSWVIALLAAIACFGLPMCGVALPQFVTYVLYGIMALSVLGIFFFNSPDKNIFMNFATGLWNTYGMATGLLGDLLSYIRLFALGLTGGVLGGVFNQLATTMTSSMDWWIRWLPMMIILLFGHGINFALCMISSFVHPMRLTFVEFFKNAEFEGGGKAYQPFKVRES